MMSSSNDLVPVERAFFSVIVKILTKVSTISDGTCRSWSSILGDLWFAMDIRHRGVAISNILNARSAICSGNRKKLSGSEAFRLAWANFRHLSQVFLEIPRLRTISARNVDDFVTWSGVDEIERALSKGRGVILLTGHFGNWELTALAAPIILNRRLNIVARPLDFIPLEKYLNEIRSQNGNRVFPRKLAARKILKCLKNNELVGVLQDQRASRHEGVIVPLLGRPAITHKGMAVLALRSGAAVVPAFSHRMTDGRYHIEVQPELYLKKTDDRKTDIIVNTELFNRVIEKQIMKYPEQWFWVHRRWRLQRKKKKRLFKH